MPQDWSLNILDGNNLELVIITQNQELNEKHNQSDHF